MTADDLKMTPLPHVAAPSDPVDRIDERPAKVDGRPSADLRGSPPILVR